MDELKQDRRVYLTALKIAKEVGGIFLGPLFAGGVTLLESFADAADDAELEANFEQLRDLGTRSDEKLQALAALAELILVKQDEIAAQLEQQGARTERPIDDVAKATALVAYRAEITQRFYYADYRGVADTTDEEHGASFSADGIYVVPRVHAETALRDERERERDLHRRLERVDEIGEDGRRQLEDELALLHQSRWRSRRGDREDEEGTPVGKALGPCRHAVIKGQPGAGKSALTRYLARTCALGADVTRDRLGWDEELVPIHLPLAVYADARRERPQLSMASHLRETWRASHGSAVEQALYEAIHRGNAIVLFDGVDEVPDDDDRRSVVRAVDAFLSQHTNSRCVVTSRPAGYYRVAGDVPHFELLNFSAAQVREFVGKWQEAFERRRHPEHPNLKYAEAEAAQMVQEIEAHPRVAELARNPLMLVIIALIRHNRLRLPERRVELYSLATRMLLDTWNRLRSEPKSNVGGSRLRLERLLPVWGRVAEWTRRERPTGFVHREELKRKLVEVLEDDEEEDPERTAESYIRAVVHTAGILEERFRNRFAFWHPTFEEFLAAISMATPSSAAADRLLPLRGDPRWREVIQLTIGYIGIITHDQRTATWVLKQLLEKDLDVLEPITQHRLRLVVDCIADDVGARRGLFEQVLNLFVEILSRQPYKLLGESFAKLVMSRMTFQPNDDTVQSLGKLIHHKDLDVRMQATRLLSNVAARNPEALERCRLALVDDHHFVRVHAAIGLARCRDFSASVCKALMPFRSAGADEALLQLLRDERLLEAILETDDAYGRFSVAKLLIEHGRGDQRIFDVLVSLLGAEEAELRGDVAELLIEHGRGDEEIYDELVSWLKAEDLLLRFIAADLLMKHGRGGKRLDRELASWLESEDPDLRLLAADILIHKGGSDEQPRAALKSLLKLDNYEVCYEAARLLIAHGDRDDEIFEALVSQLDAESGFARYYAAGMLLEENRGDHRVYEALESLCEANVGVPSLSAAMLLADQGRGEKVLTSWLGSDDLTLRSIAVEILIKQRHDEKRVLEALVPWLGANRAPSAMEAIRRLVSCEPLGHEHGEALAALVSVRDGDDARCRWARSALFDLIIRHTEGLGQLTYRCGP